jgi:UDP-GlcNAc:undecaprenyl-phosphate GlcNAc-1-phosphate transferase
VSAFLIGLLAALVVTPLLARLAPRLTWGARAAGAQAARKPEARPVPPVGGVAIALGLAAAVAAGGALPLVARSGHPSAVAAALALLAVLAVGLVDDVRPGGLSPLAKLAAQAAGLLPIVVSVALAPTGGPVAAALWLAAGLTVLNLANTFDNADGACAALSAAALLCVAAPLAGPVLGFLPFNLNARGGHDPRRTPTAYLGDAGSHLLGLLVLLALGPLAAVAALLLPALDLGRLAWLRLREGRRPWHGDRRHLAHRLAAAGLGRPAVVLVLLLVGAPGLALAGAVPGGAPPAPALLVLGLLPALAAFGIALRATPDPVTSAAAAAGGAEPCERHRSSG